MLKTSVSFLLSASGPGLSARVLLDDRCFWQGIVSDTPMKIEEEFSDSDEQQHELCIEVSGKNRYHTKLDAQGQIIEDLLLYIDDVNLDQVKLGHIFNEHAIYHHDFNGHGPETQEKFHRAAGCNGRIIFQFHTPVYLWLLENM